MIPSNCRLRNSCKRVLLDKESEEMCKLQSCVVSAEPKGGSHTKAKCPRWTTASTLPAPNSRMAQKEIVMLLWLPCPVLSSAFSCSSLCFNQSQALTVSALVTWPGLLLPQGTQQGKEWKGTEVLKSKHFPGKADLNPNAIYGNCRWKLHCFAIFSLKWELHLFHPHYKEAEVSV